MLNIIGKSKLWFTFSSILVLLSLGSLVYNSFAYGSFLRWGIDFTGGTLMEVHFDGEVQKNLLEEKINAYDEDLSPILQSIGENAFLIRTKQLSDEKHKNFILFIKGEFGDLQEPQFTSVGPTVGETMKKNAFIALAVALIAIILFIAFQFRNLPEELSSWNFGFSAIVALAHDVIITIGAFSILGIIKGIEIDTLFITALLTVMGFSVHDTIVVFDRIRENIFKKAAGDNFMAIGNKAVNQTMTRSINTSISTLLPLVALYFFGSDSISIFVLALVVGISIGTYSSIFLATPFLVAISSKDRLGDIEK